MWKMDGRGGNLFGFNLLERDLLHQKVENLTAEKLGLDVYVFFGYYKSRLKDKTKTTKNNKN